MYPRLLLVEVVISLFKSELPFLAATTVIIAITHVLVGFVAPFVVSMVVIVCGELAFFRYLAFLIWLLPSSFL